MVNGQEEKIVQLITTDPRPASDFQEAYGEVEAVDAIGTLTLTERPGAGEDGESRLTYFVFEPKDLVVMRSPSKRLVQLELKPGDVVKVEYVVSDGKQRAHAITLYSPKVTSTTTTTLGGCSNPPFVGGTLTPASVTAKCHLDLSTVRTRCHAD